MAKKKSEIHILDELKSRNITQVTLNGNRVTITSEETVGSDDEKDGYKISKPEYPTEAFTDALKALKTYVYLAWKISGKASLAAFQKTIEIRGVSFKHAGGDIKAKIRVHKQFPDGLSSEFDMPLKPLLFMDSDNEFVPCEGETLYSEDASAKLYEVMRQAKLYLGGYRSQGKLPFPENPGNEEGEAGSA